MRLESSRFPTLSELRRGEGTVRLVATASHPTLSAGTHALSFSNRHLPRKSVYLANALVPESSRLSVTGQRRDRDQSELTIAYSVSAAR